MTFRNNKRRHTIVGHGADSKIGFMLGQMELPIEGGDKWSYINPMQLKDIQNYKPIKQIKLNVKMIKNEKIVKDFLDYILYHYDNYLPMYYIPLIEGNAPLQTIYYNQIVRPVLENPRLGLLRMPDYYILFLDVIPLKKRLKYFKTIHATISHEPLYKLIMYEWDYFRYKFNIPEDISNKMEELFKTYIKEVNVEALIKNNDLKNKISKLIMYHPYLLWVLNKGVKKYDVETLLPKELISMLNATHSYNFNVFITTYFDIFAVDTYILPTLNPLMIKIKKELGETDATEIMRKFFTSNKTKEKIFKIIDEWTETNKDYMNSLNSLKKINASDITFALMRRTIMAYFVPFLNEKTFKINALKINTVHDIVDYIKMIESVNADKVYGEKNFNKVKDIIFTLFLYRYIYNNNLYKREKIFENDKQRTPDIDQPDTSNIKKRMKEFNNYLKKWGLDIYRDHFYKIYTALEFYYLLYKFK